MRARLRTRATSPTAQPLAAKTYETKASASIKFNDYANPVAARELPFQKTVFGNSGSAFGYASEFGVKVMQPALYLAPVDLNGPGWSFDISSTNASRAMTDSAVSAPEKFTPIPVKGTTASTVNS
jgi:hypothetical protein